VLVFFVHVPPYGEVHSTPFTDVIMGTLILANNHYKGINNHYKGMLSEAQYLSMLATFTTSDNDITQCLSYCSFVNLLNEYACVSDSVIHALQLNARFDLLSINLLFCCRAACLRITAITLDLPDN